MADKSSLTASYFDEIYNQSNDPWSFATSSYEAEKYAATVRLLKGRRFPRALEIGCSIGVLTEKLAPHCDELLSVDINALALEQAIIRNAGSAHVQFRQMNIPNEFPEGSFGLILVSEVAYYWDDEDDRRARDVISGALAADGLLVLVHYLPVVDEYPRTGDAAHEGFENDPRFLHRTCLRKPLYRADTFSLAV